MDKKITGRPVLEDDFNPKPGTVALHPPPPAPTMPQVQDEFYAMNMNNEAYMEQPFGGGSPLNWAFNFALDPTSAAESGTDVGGIPMDIEAWSSVRHLIILLTIVLEFFERNIIKLGVGFHRCSLYRMDMALMEIPSILTQPPRQSSFVRHNFEVCWNRFPSNSRSTRC